MSNKSAGYEPRLYHDWVKSDDLISFKVTVKETELYVRSKKKLQKKCLHSVVKYRNILEKYIDSHPMFLTTLEPFGHDESAPSIIKEMIKTSKQVNVGPMATVAGAIAEYVGKELLKYSPEVIVENGGDIFLKTSKTRVVGIYAGDISLFTPHLSKTTPNAGIGLRISPENTPLGICTSSGTVGHSLSFGTADASVVVSESTLLADAAATAVCNLVKDKNDINKGIEFAKKIDRIKGAVIIKDNQMGMWGDIEICHY